MVVPHFKMETQRSVRAVIRSQEWTVSIDIRDAYLHVPMHKAVRKYLCFVVNKQVYQFTCWIGHFTSGVHKATAPSRSSVKTVRCQAACLLRRLADLCRYSRTGPTACPDDHLCGPVSRLDHQLRQVRSNTQSGLPVHSSAPAEDAYESPVCSPTLDDQPRHHSPRSTQIAGHSGVYGNTGSTWKTTPTSSPMVGRHSSVSEDRELVRQDHSSAVGSVRGGLVGISSSPAGSSPRHQGSGSHSLHGCLQLVLGSPVRVTLDSGTVVSTSKIVSHQRCGDAGRH